MIHRIAAAYHQPSFSRSRCGWLTIDDVAIEQWLSTHLNEPDVAMLGLSIIWLVDEDEYALARRRFTPRQQSTSTIVPLLVCSDDMDLVDFGQPVVVGQGKVTLSPMQVASVFSIGVVAETKRPDSLFKSYDYWDGLAMA